MSHSIVSLYGIVSVVEVVNNHVLLFLDCILHPPLSNEKFWCRMKIFRSKWLHFYFFLPDDYWLSHKVGFRCLSNLFISYLYYYHSRDFGNILKVFVFFPFLSSSSACPFDLFVPAVGISYSLGIIV